MSNTLPSNTTRSRATRCNTTCRASVLDSRAQTKRPNSLSKCQRRACVCIQTARPVSWLVGISLAESASTATCNKTQCAVPCCTVRTPARLCLEGDWIGVSCVRAWHRHRRCLYRPYTSACLRAYKGCVKKVFPPLHVDACAVSQLPRHLLGRFLSLQYLAAVSYLGPSQLPWALVVFITLLKR
jgi:hypothetical protein